MNPRFNRQATVAISANRRINIWFGILVLIIGLIIARLFYLQIIRHDYYNEQALNSQLRESIIPADRGLIEAHEGNQVVPLVLNQKLYTLYADPGYVKDVKDTAQKVAALSGGKAADYESLMQTKGTRYVVLAKRLTETQKNQIEALKLPGVGTQGLDYRTYPQNDLASQVLGFVNDDGKGEYGVEQFMNKQLAGTPGQLKAVTDVSGVPLAASKNNINRSPVSGDSVTLTVDLGMQKQLESILKSGLDSAKSTSGSALIIDPNTGAVKAMANWPTYNPAQYYNVSDASVFNDAAVSSPLEVGSTMKVMTTSAALNLGVIKQDTTYYDPSHWDLDGHTITNIEEDGGAGTRSIADILNLSINTGATWMLMQMGGQTGVVTKTARDHWNDYMVNHFQFGKPTGIEQGYEASGYIPDPDNGYALQLTYANTAFGQAMTATPLQMAAAVSSIVNGGTYYQPYLVDQTTDSAGNTATKKPKVVRKDVVSPQVGQQIQSLMEYVVKQHFLTGFPYLNFSDQYMVGGKTGTAQIADPAGGYYADKYNGTYVGFVGGDKPQYVIVVLVNQPHIGGYAGSGAAQPIFASLAHMLIDNFGVVPKSGH